MRRAEVKMVMGAGMTRREMIAMSAAGAFTVIFHPRPMERAPACDYPMGDGVPRVDYHVHIGDGISVQRAVAIAKQRGLKFGVLQHAGMKGHGYALTDDDDLDTWIRSLDGLPVFKGIEGEGPDWMSAFSKASLARLDYAQADPFAVPDKTGKPMEIWRPEFRPDNEQEFMDRYVDYHLLLITTFPIDILAVPTILPQTLRADYDRLWTPKRMSRVIDALVKHEVALEIDSRFRVPGAPFLDAANAAGVTFAFGSNYQTIEGIGDISYGVEAYRRLELTTERFFCPGRRG